MMGGSGGSYFRGSVDLAEHARDLCNAEAKSRDMSYETSVNDLIGKYLKKFNDRDTDDIREILDKIKQELADEIDSTVDLIYGGSISRHTYLEGLSDIDTLVIIKPKDSEEVSPNYMKSLFAERLQSRYGKENVKIGDLAVTLTYQDKEIQLLPAMRDGDSYQISSSDGHSWSKINPHRFSEKLTQANSEQNRMVIPTIKIVKAIIASLPKQQQMTGYHIESLAINIFSNYKGQKTYKNMITHFFNQSIDLVITPIKDRSGQSIHVDEYLGATNSLERRNVSQALQHVQRKIEYADESKSKDEWKQLIDNA